MRLYQQQTRPTSAALIGPSGAGGTPEAFGAAIGAGLQSAAQGIGALAQVVAQQDHERRSFEAARKFSDFQTQVNDQIMAMKRSADPALGNFSDIARATYGNMSVDFLESLDPAFREEYSMRTAQFGEGVAANALEFQLQSTDNFFRTALDEELQKSRVALGQSPTKENFDAKLQGLVELTMRSGLSNAEKAVIMRNGKKALGAVLYRDAVMKEELEDNQGDSAASSAAELIGRFTTATEREQEQMAAAAQSVAVGTLGSPDLWAALPKRARAAVISLISDVGEMPKAVQNAIESGDLQALSDTIRAFGGERRTQEADLVLDPGAQLDDDPRFDEVPYEDRLALRQDAKQAAKSLSAAAAQEAKNQNEAMINALMVGLFDGTAGLADIDTLRQEGVLTKIEDIEKAHRIYKARNAEIDMKLKGQQMLAQGIAFDPSSDDERKILNALIGEQGVAALRDKDSDFAANTLIPIVRQARDIPTEALGSLIGMMRSNNQTDALWALDTLAQLQQASPRAFDARVNDSDASAVNLWQTRKDFYSPDELMKLINGGLTQTERQQTQALREEAKGVLRDQKLNIRGDLVGEFNEGWKWPWDVKASAPATAWARTQLQADFDGLFADQYTLYGDPNQAKDAALTLLKRSWGMTNVGVDGKLMKFPPEKVGYPAIAGGYNWIEDQVRSTTLFDNLGNEVPMVAANEGFELLSDAQTEREVDDFRRGGASPSYLIVRVRDGQPGVVSGLDGLPIRMYFTPTEEQKSDEAAWRAERGARFAEQDLTNAAALAVQHSIDTGLPIPPDAEGMVLPDSPSQIRAMESTLGDRPFGAPTYPRTGGGF